MVWRMIACATRSLVDMVQTPSRSSMISECWGLRAKEVKVLADTRDSMNKNVQDFATAHNAVAAKVSELGDKLSKQEFRIANAVPAK